MGKKQAEKPADAVTPESVDDMTDEQVSAVMDGMKDEAPEEEVQTEETAKAPEPADDEADKAQKAEESADQDDPDTDDPDKQSDKAETVDFKRYDYERNRRKEAEKQRDAEKAEWARRFDELLKAQQNNKPAEKQDDAPVIPSEEDDPMAAIKWLKEQVVAGQQQREQETTEQRQQREQWENQQVMLNEAGAEFQQASAVDPSLKEAYDTLVNSFQAEATAYRLPPREAAQYLANTEMQHIAFAKQNRIPIDEYIKTLAQARGWQAKPVQQQAQPQQDTTEAQKKAKSLSNGGGSPGVSDNLTAQQILDMPEKEFDAIIEKYGSVANALAAQ